MKGWFERNIKDPAPKDVDEGLRWDLPWGRIYGIASEDYFAHNFLAADEDAHYGPLEGCILITYGDYDYKS